jgi:hypothetical protein
MSKKEPVYVRGGRLVRLTYHLECDCRYIAIAVDSPYVYYFDGNGILTRDLYYNISPWSLKNLYTQTWRAPKLTYNFVVGNISSPKVLRKAAERMHVGEPAELFFKYAQEENIIHKRHKELGRFIRRISEPSIKVKKSKDGGEKFCGASLKIYFNPSRKYDPIVFFTSRLDDLIRIARKKLAGCKNFERFNLDVEALSCDVSYTGEYILLKFKIS